MWAISCFAEGSYLTMYVVPFVFKIITMVCEDHKCDEELLSTLV